MRTRIAIAAGGVLLAISGATPAGAIQHEVDYRNFTRCAYSPTDSGWALVGRAPKGTSSVIFTMRTGTPGAWGAVSVRSSSKARRWWVTTPAGTSFINWVTFLDSADGIITQQNVNTRCAGTPSQWPQ